MLLNEFFTMPHEEKEDSEKALCCLIDKVLPSVLHKTNYEKAFINKEAKDVMTRALTVCQHKELLSVLLDCNHNKIQALMENIASFIGTFIQSASKAFFQDYASVSADH